MKYNLGQQVIISRNSCYRHHSHICSDCIGSKVIITDIYNYDRDNRIYKCNFLNSLHCNFNEEDLRPLVNNGEELE